MTLICVQSQEIKSNYTVFDFRTNFCFERARTSLKMVSYVFHVLDFLQYQSV